MISAQHRARLRKLIEGAFAVVPYPGDDDLVEPHCPECKALTEAFKGKRWTNYKDHPLALLGVDHQEAFAFFTPRAFRYYLPLAMLAIVDLYEETDLLPQSLIMHLSPSPTGHEWHDARLSPLTPAELRAVATFLRFLHEYHSDDLGEPSRTQIRAGLKDLEQRLAHRP